MNKYILLFSVLLLSSLSSSAQLQDLNVISANGGTFKESSFSLDWTLGETIIATGSSDELLITQGFHQPNILIKELPGPIVTVVENIKVRISPNPVTSVLSINLQTHNNEKTSIQITDMFGRILHNSKPADQKYVSINLSNYQQGTYFLLVRNEQGKLVKSFKVIKLK